MLAISKLLKINFLIRKELERLKELKKYCNGYFIGT
jgi:hypothetical protein